MSTQATKSSLKLKKIPIWKKSWSTYMYKIEHAEVTFENTNSVWKCIVRAMREPCGTVRFLCCLDISAISFLGFFWTTVVPLQAETDQLKKFRSKRKRYSKLAQNYQILVSRRSNTSFFKSCHQIILEAAYFCTTFFPKKNRFAVTEKFV